MSLTTYKLRVTFLYPVVDLSVIVEVDQEGVNEDRRIIEHAQGIVEADLGFRPPLELANIEEAS